MNGAAEAEFRRYSFHQLAVEADYMSRFIPTIWLELWLFHYVLHVCMFKPGELTQWRGIKKRDFIDACIGLDMISAILVQKHRR